MPYLSASAVVIHYEEALYQVYAPLPLPYHHHHQVVRSDSRADSTTDRRKERSLARRKAETKVERFEIMLDCVKSELARRRGRPGGRHQSAGRRPVDARSARVWSSKDSNVPKQLETALFLFT